MGTDYGVAYVAYGQRAVSEARQSIASLRAWHDWPIVTVSDERIDGAERVEYDCPGWGARGAKLNLNNLVPPSWDRWLYIDADTRVRGDIAAGFEIIADGWDLAITASEHQEQDWLWHIPAHEREAMAGQRLLGPVLQGGLWFAARNERTGRFFEAWRDEWQQYGREDQGALIRALRREPVRVWLLGRDWNGGELVEHLFGRARNG